MPKVPNKNKKIANLELLCGWQDCKVQCYGVWNLNSHIADAHLKNLQEPIDELFSCSWEECNFKSKCKIELKRHVYYHGYYTNLILNGKHEVEQIKDLPTCTATSRKGQKVPLLQTNFDCQWENCEYSFLSIVEFHNHIENHASFDYDMERVPENEFPKIKCNWKLCGKENSNKYRFLEHVLTHSNKKHFACNNCGEIFRTKASLHDHFWRQKNVYEMNFQCKQCYKFFATRKLMRCHAAKHVKHNCEFCKMRCNSAISLRRHTETCPLKYTRFRCPVCNLECKCKFEVIKHIKVHDLLHKCTEPDCLFSTNTNLLFTHDSVDDNDNELKFYICSFCDCCFQTSDLLSRHLNNEHDLAQVSARKDFSYRLRDGFYRLETASLDKKQKKKFRKWLQIKQPMEIVVDQPAAPIMVKINNGACADDNDDNNYCEAIVGRSMPSLDD